MKGEFNYYAVTGNPISHSISPYIFNHLFQESGVSSYYSRLLAHNAKDAMNMMGELKIKGLNITAPYKEEMFHLIKNVEDEAKEIGAINAITTMAGMRYGSNTDVFGIMQTIDDMRINLEGREVLILGAGGAGRAAVKGLIAGTKKIRILNRTVDKAKIIADQYGIEYDSLDNYKKYISDVDIIVSTLPDNVNLDLSGVDKFAVFINANYHKPQEVKYANYISGEAWLMNQAMQTYNLFTWYQPEKHDFVRAMHSPRKQFSNLFLVGFSGSGKSTIGKALADKMGMAFLDADVEIEKHAGKPINKIFEEDGEYGFRKLEFDVLKKMSVVKNTVIATGGGAVEFQDARELMHDRGYVLYCYAPLDVCMKRADKSVRPKLNVSEEELKDFFEGRKRLYYVASDLIVNTDYDFNKIIDTLEYDLKRTISHEK
jgi:shikimate dehydrogenase